MSAVFALFLLFGGLAVVSALAVILHPHPVYSALALVVTLFQIAVLFLLLEAHVIAFLQILIYAGAIMVLFLFVIMLLNVQRESETLPRPAWRVTVLAVGGVLALELVLVLARSRPRAPRGGLEGFGSVEALGRALFSEHALSFEVTSVLLLVAIIGSVVLAKRRLE